MTEPARRGDVSVVRWWQSLQPVFRDPTIGPAIKLAFGWLWWNSGGEPGKLVVCTSVIAAELGAQREAACRWLHALEDRNLIEIVDWDRATGMVHLYTNDPACGVRSRPQRPDPQAAFPFQEEAEPEGAGTVSIPLNSEGVTECGHSVTPQDDRPNGGGGRGNPSSRNRLSSPSPSSSRIKDDKGSSIDEGDGGRGTGDDQGEVEGEWKAVREEANRVAQKLWPARDWSGSPLPEGDRSLILKVVWLSRNTLSAEWLWDAVEGVVQVRPTKAAGYLYTCLGNACKRQGEQFNRLLAGVELPEALLRPRNR
ncbi:MAG TPA: hypothetical protein VMY37_05615 [Thermoguttaceae bacterium]|nr:hypothetical protein [Thermoguttaceae bacterium]